MADGVTPVAIGLISDPPAIVLSYDVTSNGQRKRRKRKMPLRDFTDRSNVKRYAFNLRQRHGKYLADIIDVTLEKLLRTIQEIQKGNSVSRSLEIVSKEYTVDPDEDLNKLSPTKLALRKAVMDETFHKNLVKPNDPDFIYDKEIQFQVENDKVDTNEWDEESEKAKLDRKPNLEMQQRKEERKDGSENILLDPTSVGTEQTELQENEPFEDSKLTEVFTALRVNEDIKNASDKHVKPESLGEKGPSLRANIDLSSSSNDVDDALDHKIETNIMDEDDEEDFWK